MALGETVLIHVCPVSKSPTAPCVDLLTLSSGLCALNETVSDVNLHRTQTRRVKNKLCIFTFFIKQTVLNSGPCVVFVSRDGGFSAGVTVQVIYNIKHME